MRAGGLKYKVMRGREIELSPREFARLSYLMHLALFGGAGILASAGKALTFCGKGVDNK